jgi:hypothetical protein
MHWLLHGELTPAVAEALVRRGDKVHTPAELDLPPGESAEAVEIARAAQSKQWDVLTSDAGLVSAVFDAKFPFNRSMVYLQLEGGDVEQDDALDRLFERYKRLSPRRLYTVTGTRVKIRQLPGS